MGKKGLKKKCRAIALIVCAVIMLLLTEALTAVFYYRDANGELSFIEALWLALENIPVVFTGDAQVAGTDIYTSFFHDASVYGKMAIVLFGILRIGFLLAGYAVLYYAAVNIFRRDFFDFGSRKKIKIAIFGYDDYVKTLINNTDMSQYKLYLILHDHLEEDEEKDLFSKKVTFDYVDNYCEDADILKNCSYILLLHAEPLQNAEIYMNLVDKCNYLPADIKIFLMCDDLNIERLIDAYFAEHKQYDLEVIDKSGRIGREIFSEFYRRDSQTRDDMHLLMFGFGDMGYGILIHAINMAVRTSSNSICIDIIDDQIETVRNIIKSNVSDECIEERDNVIRVKEELADGELTIRFTEIDFGLPNFLPYFCRLTEGKYGMYTHAVALVQDDSTEIRFVKQLSDLLREKAIKIPLALNRNYVKGIDDTFRNEKAGYMYSYIFYMKDMMPEGCASVIDKKVNDDAKRINYEYNKWYASINGEIGGNRNSADTVWKGMKLFQRNSSRMLAGHLPVKKSKFTEEMRHTLSDVKNAVDKDKLLHLIDENDEVQELVRLEHRRWNYYMIFDSWKPYVDAPDADKDNINRRHPCLCSWENMKKNAAVNETKVYDFIPYFILSENL